MDKNQYDVFLETLRRLDKVGVLSKVVFTGAQGGAIFSLADSAVAMALLGLVEKGERFMTVEMNINYVSPFREGNITAEARIVKKGSRIALGDVNVRDDQGGLVAKCLATYTIMK